jgi:hypothetical protein
MSFSLKNAEATYQRAIQMCLDKQIGCNVEAYIDDVVIKTKTSADLIADLEETFKHLKEFRWKLNPTKCIFGVPFGILLGYIVSARGIEPNPEKISVITNMKRPTCVKDIQKLSGCMAALSHFVSRLGEKAYLSSNCSKLLSDSFGRTRLCCF